MFRRSLVIGQGKYVGLGLRTVFHLFDQQGEFAQKAAVDEMLRDIVEAECDTLILVITVIVVLFQITFFFGRYHFPH